MASLIDWVFPCFNIGRSDSPVGASQPSMEHSQKPILLEDRAKPTDIPYRTSMARSMYYSGAPSTPKDGQTSNGRQRGANAAAKQPHTATNHLRIKPARPELTVCIPSSRYRAPPVEKSRLSPDSALDDQHALQMAYRNAEQARHSERPRRMFFPSSEKKVPVEKSAFSATSTAASEQSTATINPFDTPASSMPSAPAGRRAAKGAKNTNLSDELALFSITSRDEELPALSERPMEGSAKVVSALRCKEVKSSIHDWAHEEHRDLATQLTPSCLDLARRLGQNEEAKFEMSEPEDKTH